MFQVLDKSQICSYSINLLRSAGSGLLVVPQVSTKHGEAAFSFYAAHIWNKLPEDLRLGTMLTTFKFNICLS